MEIVYFFAYWHHICYPVSPIRFSDKNFLYEYPPSNFSKYKKISENEKAPILFVGCSFTKGDYLEEHQSLPAKVQKLTNRFCYNWGMSGYGPAHFLTLFLLENQYHLISQKPEYIIYTYMFHHLDRFSEPEIYDFYRKQHYIPNQNYNFLYHSYIYKYLQNSKLSDWIYDEEKMDNALVLFFTIMYDMKVQSEKLFPNSKFIILLYSDVNKDLCEGIMQNNKNANRVNKMFEIMYSDEFKNKLERLGYKVLSTEELIGRKMDRETDRVPKSVDPNYPHPSNSAWDEIAPKLVQKLNL